MTRPSVAPDFATDANYVAAGKPWDGQPTKVTPGAIKTEGWEPQVGLAAQHVNYMLNNHGGWINYLDENAGSAGLFGDGSDGALSFDGASAVAGCTRSGSVYTATRDLHASSASFAASVQLKMAGYALYCTGLLDLSAANCIISNDGNAGTGTTGGAVAANKFGTSAGSAGTDGVVGPANGTTAASNVLNGLGAVGGDGGASGGGQTGGAHAAVSAPSNWRAGLVYQLGYFVLSAGLIYLQGGGGGTGGGAAGGGTSGAGGGGGGILIVSTWAINISGTSIIRAIGANGSNASAGNAGGGGGGGGGAVLLSYRRNAGSTDPSTRVSMTGGGGGAGTGTGSTGTSGSAGTAYVRLV